MSISILRALDDPRLFGGALRDKATWGAWRAFLAALFALPMTEAEAEIYRACTGRSALPTQAFIEAWLACGRRGGKSFVLALIAVYLGCFRDYREYLGPGERATIKVIAADRRQARVIMRFIKGLLAIPALAGMVESETAESIDLSNMVTIEVGTASHRTLRGYTLAAALGDEAAFWPQEDSASPDFEILAALRPAMATIPNAMLLMASSPYSRRGALWEAYKQYFGKDDPNVLFWRAPTRTMNPTVPQRLIDEAFERDPASAAAEYGAEFRLDIEGFVSREVVDAVTIPGRHEIPFIRENDYVAFVDPSGGSADSMTLAIAHAEGEIAVLDLVREIRPPFSPDAVVTEFVETIKSYGLSDVTGDRWGAAFVREQFEKRGVTYKVSERDKSAIYRELLPLMNSRRCEILDITRLAAQLLGLERKVARGGRDSIDHAQSGHDDVANAAAGALVLASSGGGGFDLATWLKAYG